MRKTGLLSKVIGSLVLLFSMHQAQAQSCSINTNVNGNAGTGNYSGTIGQSFTACGSGTLATIKAQASNTSSATAIVRIYNGEGEFGTLLGQGAAIAVSSNRTNTWNIENLNIKVVSGQKYTAMFLTASGTATFQYSTSTQYNYYAGGQVINAGAANNDMFFSATIVRLSPTLTPTHLATSVSRLSPLTLQFDRPMKVNTGNLILKNLTTNTNVDTINVSELEITSSLVKIPSTVLAPNTQYQITIPATALSSTSGISYEGKAATEWTFTTGSGSVPVIASTLGGKTNATTIPFTISFTEAVTGFDISDLVITNGTASNFTGSGTSYSVQVTPTAVGNVSIQIPVNITTEGNEMASSTVFFDNIAPTVITQNDTVRLNTSGTGTITVADINKGSTDNITKTANLTLSLNKLAFNCVNLGNNTVVLSVTDSVGNVSTATANVYVVPALPVLVAKNITVQLAANGSVSILPADVINTATVYCAETLQYTLDTSSFTCADLGANTVKITATGSGNQVSTTAIVTVQNKKLPNVLTKNINAQVVLSTGKVTITPQMVDNGSAGLCGGAVTLSLSKSAFTCNELGANTVTLSVQDAQGNINTGTAIVTVVAAIEDQNLTATLPVVTPGTSTTITTAGSQVGVNYTLRNNAGNVKVGNTLVGTGNSLSFNTGNLTANQTFNVIGESSLYTNSALDFDGVNDYVQTNVKLTATNTLSIEAWVFPRANVYNRLISNFTNTSVSGDFVLDTYNATNNGKALRFVIYGAASASQITTVPNVLTSNEWNHVAATFDNGEIKLYVNGVQVANSTAGFAGIAANNNAIRIGEDVTIGTAEYFNGKMDDIRIWNTARTVAEIQANMNTCLSGAETGLKAYFKISEGTGTTITDLKGNTTATLTGMDPATDWVSGKVDCIASSCSYQMSNLVTVTVDNTTGLSDVEGSNAKITIAPNPVVSDLNIQSDTEVLKVGVYSILGDLMLTSTQNTVNVSVLTSGVYIVELTTKAGVYKSRFVKE